jgi:Histidine kinase-, DNA gyrase B-, and HSP90-like ATPase
MHEAELVGNHGAPAVARELIARWFAGTHETIDIQLAKLLTSELVSNAVVHGRGRITLRAGLDEDRLLVEVLDEGDGLPAIREGRFQPGNGWGLKIVDAASSRWGVHEGTTHVWFEIERPGPRLGPEKNPARQGGPSEPEGQGDGAALAR